MAAEPEFPSAVHGSREEPFYDLLHPSDNRNNNANTNTIAPPAVPEDSSSSPVDLPHILPSYDFQTTRSIAPENPPSPEPNPVESGARPPSASPEPIHYSADIKVISSTEGGARAKPESREMADSLTIAAVEEAMKKHMENVTSLLEGMNARLSQLERSTQQLGSYFEGLRISERDNHREAEDRLRRLEDLIKEIHGGIHVLCDKQVNVESQPQLMKPSAGDGQEEVPHNYHPSFPVSMPAQPVPPPPPVPSMGPTNMPNESSISAPTHPPPYYPQQSPPQFPFQPQVEAAPPYNAVSVSVSSASPLPSSNLSPATPPNNSYIVADPPPPPYLPSGGHYTTSAPHPYGGPSPPPVYESSPSRGHAGSGSFPAQPPPPLPPQMYESPPSRGHAGGGSFPAQPTPPPPPPMYESPPSRGHGGGGSFPAQPPPPQSYPPQPYPPQSQLVQQPGYSGNYRGPRVPPSAPSSGGRGYPPQRLPTAQPLPHALPTSPRGGGGPAAPLNRGSVDEVVDKIASMGFNRDQVRAVARQSAENGLPVDFNSVLDKLTSGGVQQASKLYYGN